MKSKELNELLKYCKLLNIGVLWQLKAFKSHYNANSNSELLEALKNACNE